MLFACLVALALCAAGQTPPAPALPEIRVEYFGAERGFIVGPERLNLLCVVRNIGAGALPAETMRLRCYTLAGLDYTTGDTWPALPALAAGQAVAYRWSLLPTAGKGPMIAAALLQNAPPRKSENGPRPAVVTDAKEPQAVLAVIPRLDDAPHLYPLAVAPAAPPKAQADDVTAWVGNDRAGVRVRAAQNGEPLLLLGAESGAAWQTLAVGSPLLTVRSGEDGQIPWNQSLKWKDSRVRADHESATLTLRGTIGVQWRAELQIEARRETAVMQGLIRLTARRPMRLYAVSLPRLIAAEPKNLPGSFNGLPISLANEPPVLSQSSRVAAAAAHGVVFGLAWPDSFLFPNWKATRLPQVLPPAFITLGATWNSDLRGTVVLPGATLEIPFRLFALAPGDTARDALRFAYPDTP